MARVDDDHFRQFAATLERVLAEHQTPTGPELLRHQRGQIQALVKLETDLRELLIEHPWGPGVYRDFIKFICDKKRNILAARPYFRERQTMFTKYISKALRDRNDKALYRWRFNWMFVDFVLRARKWPPGGKVVAIVDKIKKIRNDILEQNLPLPISQARGFWGHTPQSHLAFMDIIQIQAQGLLLAIDKFVPPRHKMTDRQSLEAYRKFRAVAIGIMTRDRVNEYSATLMHFYPKDRAKMYRANKLMRRYAGTPNWEEVAATVNRELDDPTCVTTSEEISSLLAAGSTVSGDYRQQADGEEGETILEAQADDEHFRPDTDVEDRDALASLRTHGRGLQLRERKLLRMKGIKL